MTKLTRDILIKIGFQGSGKSITGNPLYRLDVAPYKGTNIDYFYAYDIQIELNESLPDTNGNSGILSLYSALLKDQHLLDGELRSADKIKFINIPEMNIPIAWHVTTLERLNEIYTSLTLNEPLAYLQL